MDKKKTQVIAVIVTIVLVLIVPASVNYVTPLIAQTDGTGEDTSSASQDYQDFQSCLSNAEVDGSVSEQQIRDCFAPIYNTGTVSGSEGTTTSTDSPSGDEGTSNADNTGSEGDEEEGGAAE